MNRDFYKEIEQAIADYDATPDGVVHDIVFDATVMILRELEIRGWSQKQLADAAGISPVVLSRLLNGASNCELKTLARLFLAIGVRPQLVDKREHNRPAEFQSFVTASKGYDSVSAATREVSDGEEQTTQEHVEYRQAFASVQT